MGYRGLRSAYYPHELSRQSNIFHHRSNVVSNYAHATIAILTIVSSLLNNRHADAVESNPDYTALNRAVRDGRDVHMLIDFSGCQLHGTNNSGPPVKGSMRFDGYMIQADETIAFATTHFTLRSDKSPVTEFLSFRVHTDGKMDARTVILNASTFAILQDTAFDCKIGKGATFNW